MAGKPLLLSWTDGSGMRPDYAGRDPSLSLLSAGYVAAACAQPPGAQRASAACNWSLPLARGYGAVA